MRNISSTCLVLGLLVLLTACDGNIREFGNIAQLQWKSDQIITVKLNIDDTRQKYNMLVGLRHASNIQMGAVKVKIKQTSPSGKTLEKEYILPLRDKETGDLLGSAMGDMCDTDTPIGKDVQFDEKGIYTFDISQLMGDDISPFLEAGIILNQIKEE